MAELINCDQCQDSQVDLEGNLCLYCGKKQPKLTKTYCQTCTGTGFVVAFSPCIHCGNTGHENGTLCSYCGGHPGEQTICKICDGRGYYWQ